MTKTLTHEDIRTLLKNFAAAIDLDQRLVDAMPRAKFKPEYDDRMWRDWRSGHISFINKVLSSIATIPPLMLIELTRIATTCEPKRVGKTVLEQFAEVVGGCCEEEDCATAERFFFWVIKEVGMHTEGSRPSQDARGSMLRWLAVNDPLYIAQDPECGCGEPAGSVS